MILELFLVLATADLIVGFPTETEEMFQNTMDIIEKLNITWVHAFPYSERKGTPAERIPKKVPMPIRRERAKKLRYLSNKLQSNFFKSQIGNIVNVLVEKNNRGYTEHYALVEIEDSIPEGSLVQVQITGLKSNNTLQGKIIMEEAV